MAFFGVNFILQKFFLYKKKWQIWGMTQNRDNLTALLRSKIWLWIVSKILLFAFFSFTTTTKVRNVKETQQGEIFYISCTYFEWSIKTYWPYSSQSRTPWPRNYYSVENWWWWQWPWPGTHWYLIKVLGVLLVAWSAWISLIFPSQYSEL